MHATGADLGRELSAYGHRNCFIISREKDAIESARRRRADFFRPSCSKIVAVNSCSKFLLSAAQPCVRGTKNQVCAA
jgi:hypothetical protein